MCSIFLILEMSRLRVNSLRMFQVSNHCTQSTQNKDIMITENNRDRRQP